MVPYCYLYIYSIGTRFNVLLTQRIMATCTEATYKSLSGLGLIRIKIRNKIRRPNTVMQPTPLSGDFGTWRHVKRGGFGHAYCRFVRRD